MKKVCLLFTILTLSACAKPHVVDIVVEGDEDLNCKQLEIEIAKLDKFIDEAESEKGATWGNAGRLLVFPIGILATYDNANEAINAAKQREVYLRGIMGRKKC